MNPNKRKLRPMSVLATDKQKKFAECIVAGMNQTEAAKIAYPDSSNPRLRGSEAMKSKAVKNLVSHAIVKNLKVEATAVPYKVLMDICRDPEASDSNKIKAANSIFDRYGMGSMKGENGEIMDLAEMSDAELEEFIEKAEARKTSIEAKDGDFELMDDNTVDSEQSGD